MDIKHFKVEPEDVLEEQVYRTFSRLEELAEPTFNLRLIEAVKHSKCLFDMGDRQYRNTEYKNKVWNRLVTVLNFEGDPRSLASRWKQLRDKYGKEKRKVKYTNEPSTWQYFKHLHFLNPHMTDRADISPSRRESQDVQIVITDPTFATRLIEEVRMLPSLIDHRDPKYRHPECRHAAWSQIINNLHYPGSTLSVSKQWKKLRDRYVREKRRIKMQSAVGIHEESTWELYNQMTWMDTFLDDRAQMFYRQMRPEPIRFQRSLKRHADEYDIDDLSFIVMDKRSHGDREAGPSGDVLLDGDSAFSASVVSDLRTLPPNARAIAKRQIEVLIETGKMPY